MSTPLPEPIRIASRASALALRQTEMVVAALAPAECQVIPTTTRGDAVQDRALAEIGGKGLFIKALEERLLAGQADLAVHSAKDMETTMAEGTMLAALLPREDRRDALIGPYESLQNLPDGARIGTASVRRRALLLARRPDLQISLLRGNLQTRLAKLEAGDFDAIILAKAGLNRLGINPPHSVLEETVMLPAAAQGAIAIQARMPQRNQRAASIAAMLARLNDSRTADEVTAERALLATLDGSCRSPIAASAHCQGETLHLTAAIATSDGSTLHQAEAEDSRDNAAKLGHQLGNRLLEMAGGRSFLLQPGDV